MGMMKKLFIESIALSLSSHKKSDEHGINLLRKFINYKYKESFLDTIESIGYYFSFKRMSPSWGDAIKSSAKSS